MHLFLNIIIVKNLRSPNYEYLYLVASIILLYDPKAFILLLVVFVRQAPSNYNLVKHCLTLMIERKALKSFMCPNGHVSTILV